MRPQVERRLRASARRPKAAKVARTRGARPYGCTGKSHRLCRGGFYIRPWQRRYRRCLPGRICNAPLHPRSVAHRIVGAAIGRPRGWVGRAVRAPTRCSAKSHRTKGRLSCGRLHKNGNPWRNIPGQWAVCYVITLVKKRKKFAPAKRIDVFSGNSQLNIAICQRMWYIKD